MRTSKTTWKTASHLSERQGFGRASNQEARARGNGSSGSRFAPVRCRLVRLHTDEPDKGPPGSSLLLATELPSMLRRSFAAALLLTGSLFSLMAAADDTRPEVPLWPAGAPGFEGRKGEKEVR